MTRLGFLAFLVLVAASTTALAQFDVNGPNARQLIQGVVGSVVDPVDHDVDVTLPGLFRLTVESGVNPNMPIATIMSPLQPTPGVIPTPWGGAIDIGSWDPTVVLANATILGDAITFSGNPNLDPFFVTGTANPFTGAPPTFELTAQFGASAIPAGLTSVTRAFQTIVYDPTAAPLNLDNTEATDANFVRGQSGVLLTGDDGFVTVPFIGGTFEFHGQVYSSVTVCANGFVTFGGPPTTANLGADGDHLAWLNDRPSIAALLSDWDPRASSPTDGVWYEEYAGIVTIGWGDPRAQSSGGIAHAGDSDQNYFRLNLVLDGAGQPLANGFVIEHPTLDPSAGALYGSGLIGHTPGAAALLGGAFDVSLRNTNGSAGAGIAQIEEHDANGSNLANLGWDGAGSLRCYNDITRQWSGAQIVFSPNPGFVVAGDMGYQSTATGPPADDVSGLDVPSIAKTGGQVVEFCGSFRGFDPLNNGIGTVVFDPMGLQGGPYPATVYGILDSTGSFGGLSLPNPQPGPHRDSQALRVQTPAMPGVTGSTTARLSFHSGAQFDVPVSVSATPGPSAVYSLGDDAFVMHALTVPVVYYGQSWSDIFIGSNGYITFGAGSNASGGGALYVESGLGTANTPSVCAMFSDLNPLGIFSGATYEVHEDLAQGLVEVVFRAQYFWSTIEYAGTVKVRFGKQGPGSVEIDYAQFFPAVSGMAPITIGLSDGNPATPFTDFSNGQGSGMHAQTLAGGGTGFTSPAGGHSLLETFPQNTVVPFTTLVFRDLATAAPYGLWWLF